MNKLGQRIKVRKQVDESMLLEGLADPIIDNEFEYERAHFLGLLSVMDAFDQGINRVDFSDVVNVVMNLKAETAYLKGLATMYRALVVNEALSHDMFERSLLYHRTEANKWRKELHGLIKVVAECRSDDDVVN